MRGIAERKRPVATTRKGQSGATYESEFKSTLNRTHLHLDLAFIRLLDRACQKRDVNRSSYMRRAIAVQIAHDLGMSIQSVLWHSPSVGRYRSHQINKGKRDRAEGIEQWCPHPGCGGKHFIKN